MALRRLTDSRPKPLREFLTWLPRHFFFITHLPVRIQATILRRKISHRLNRQTKNH